MPVENEKRSATEQGERLIEALTGIRRAIEAIGLTVVAVGQFVAHGNIYTFAITAALYGYCLYLLRKDRR